MAKAIKGREHDSTAAMANAYFGTEGCGDAIERVFGNKDKEPGMESKTDTQVSVPDSQAKSPLFEIPDHGYVVDLSQVQGVGLVAKSHVLFPTYGFRLDLVGRVASKPIEWADTSGTDACKRKVESAREAVLAAWHKYKALAP